MARVLVLTQVLPFPLDAGPKVRAYYMLRHLSRQHEVTLVSFVRPDDSPDAIAHLRRLCQFVHTVPIRRSVIRNLRAGLKGLLTGLPMVVARDEVTEMFGLLRRLMAESNFDVVHADQLSMAGYGQFAAHCATKRQPCTLLDEHNAIYLLAQRMAEAEPRFVHKAIMTRESRAFRRYEAAMCRAYDAILTVTEEDRTHLLALLQPSTFNPPPITRPPPPPITPIPICVDPELTPVVVHQPAPAPTILLLGAMFWPPNVQGVLWFGREVLPLIHQRLPDARFVVVGKNPPPEVLALTFDSRIRVTGYVADPTPYLAAANVFIVPLAAGGGMRVKILDAWLWGLPVVSTSIGAEGISLRHGENILLADNATTFADATARLLTDPALNLRLRQAGRAWVEATYAWQSVYRRVDEVYTRLLNTPPG